MTIQIFSIIFFSVTLSALAQISLKYGMSSPAIQTGLEQSSAIQKLFFIVFTNPYILIGFLMYIGGAMLWLFVLAKLDVSMAYPYIGLGFIITMLFGALLLGETLSLSRVIGTLLVVGGVTLISLPSTPS